MLKQFEAADDVPLRRLGLGQLLGGGLPIVHGDAAFQRVQPRHFQRRLAHVDAAHLGASQRHPLGQQAAAAAHIQRRLACQRRALVDEIQA